MSRDLGFRDKSVNWIMECIVITSLSVLVNGKPGTSFKPERGIQQDNPISPYIFIICADCLGW